MARLRDILRGWGLAVPLRLILIAEIGLKSRGLVSQTPWFVKLAFIKAKHILTNIFLRDCVIIRIESLWDLMSITHTVTYDLIQKHS